MKRHNLYICTDLHFYTKSCIAQCVSEQLQEPVYNRDFLDHAGMQGSVKEAFCNIGHGQSLCHILDDNTVAVQ